MTSGTDILAHPIYPGLGATAAAEPEFTSAPTVRAAR